MPHFDAIPQKKTIKKQPQGFFSEFLSVNSSKAEENNGDLPKEEKETIVANLENTAEFRDSK